MKQLVNTKMFGPSPPLDISASLSIYPLHLTSRPPLPPTLSPWVRQVTNTYSGLSVH